MRHTGYDQRMMFYDCVSACPCHVDISYLDRYETPMRYLASWEAKNTSADENPIILSKEHTAMPY